MATRTRRQLCLKIAQCHLCSALLDLLSTGGVGGGAGRGTKILEVGRERFRSAQVVLNRQARSLWSL